MFNARAASVLLARCFFAVYPVSAMFALPWLSCVMWNMWSSVGRASAKIGVLCFPSVRIISTLHNNERGILWKKSVTQGHFIQVISCFFFLCGLTSFLAPYPVCFKSDVQTAGLSEKYIRNSNVSLETSKILFEIAMIELRSWTFKKWSVDKNAIVGLGICQSSEWHSKWRCVNADCRHFHRRQDF